MQLSCNLSACYLNCYFFVKNRYLNGHLTYYTCFEALKSYTQHEVHEEKMSKDSKAISLSRVHSESRITNDLSKMKNCLYVFMGEGRERERERRARNGRWMIKGRQRPLSTHPRPALRSRPMERKRGQQIAQAVRSLTRHHTIHGRGGGGG